MRVGNLPLPNHTRRQVAIATALECAIFVDTRAESLPRLPCFRALETFGTCDLGIGCE